MLFRQFFDDLSCTFTYLIGSETSREAVIIDPVLENVDEYLLELNKLNLGLIKVIETHTHADHFSGSFKLKDKTNCKIKKIKSNIQNEVKLAILKKATILKKETDKKKFKKRKKKDN